MLLEKAEIALKGSKEKSISLHVTFACHQFEFRVATMLHFPASNNELTPTSIVDFLFTFYIADFAIKLVIFFWEFANPVFHEF